MIDADTLRAAIARAKATGRVSALLATLGVELPDSALQEIDDALHLNKGRTANPLVAACNTKRAALIHEYKRYKTTRGFDRAAFDKAYTAHADLPDGTTLTHDDAFALITNHGSRSPALRALLRER